MGYHGAIWCHTISSQVWLTFGHDRPWQHGFTFLYATFRALARLACFSINKGIPWLPPLFTFLFLLRFSNNPFLSSYHIHQPFDFPVPSIFIKKTKITSTDLDQLSLCNITSSTLTTQLNSSWYNPFTRVMSYYIFPPSSQIFTNGDMSWLNEVPIYVQSTFFLGWDAGWQWNFSSWNWLAMECLTHCFLVNYANIRLDDSYCF